MKKVTTTSDVELIIVPLNKEGQDRVNKGQTLNGYEDCVLGVEGKYYKVRCRVKGVEFVAIHPIEGTCKNCYESTTDIGGLQDVPALLVTIPSGTFKSNGILEIAITSNEASDHFIDNTKDTESVFEKTEVYYVSQ
jgi:hypothetical protein